MCTVGEQLEWNKHTVELEVMATVHLVLSYCTYPGVISVGGFICC